MNILIFSWRDPKHPMAGGAEQVMHEHAKGWVKGGHNVTLFSSYFNGAKREENLDGVKITRRGVQILGVQILAFFWYLFAEHLKFDLVVDQFHGIPFFTPLYVRAKRLAVTQEVAKEVWLMNHLPKPFNWIFGGIGFVLEPFIFLFYKRVRFMTGSLSAKEDLTKFGIPSRNITIVPHGVIIQKIKIEEKKAGLKTIAYLGALTKDKGVEDAIRAFSLLKLKRNYEFWIIGRGSGVYLRDLKELAQRLAIRNKIKFWDYVDDKKKFSLLAKTHLLINPSVREGWGLVNIEANAVGTPVVAYNSPGLVDSVKNEASGVIIRKNTPKELAQTIEKILEDEERYKSLQRGAIQWSKNFSWKRSKIMSLTLINNIYGKN